MAALADHVASIARKYGISVDVFRALIQQESGGNQAARSPKGAIGRTQLMPATAAALGVNPNDPIGNLVGGARYLRQQLDHFGGDYHKALAAYNAGPGAVEKYGGVPPFAETQNYVRSILRGGTPTASAANAAKSGGSSRSTRTIPGVDRSQERRALILQFLQQRNRPGSVVSLATGLQAAKDTPSRTVSTSSGPKASAASLGPSQGTSGLLEMFYNGPGGINVKDGQREPRGFVSGHTDHVHVAAGPKTVTQIGRLAQQMGLSVGENPHFGGVNPVHVKDSYHYKNQAIDVSGNPALMRRFNHTVARRFGVGR